MRQVVTSIILLAFLGQTFNQGWYYLGYLIQQKQYMERCVNKARPQMHCNGKCQLQQQLQEQDEKERGLLPALKLMPDSTVISSKSFFPAGCAICTVNSAVRYFSYTIGSPVDFPSSLFHPPDELC